MIFLFGSLHPLQTTPETYTHNEWINEGEYYDFRFHAYSGFRISGNFSVNKGEYIEFFICDSGNLTNWLNGTSIFVYDHQDVEEFYSFAFILPYAETWHLVFSNVNLTSTGQRHITLNIILGDSSPSLPSTVSDMINQMYLMYLLEISLIASMVAIVIVVFVRRSRITAAEF